MSACPDQIIKQQVAGEPIAQTWLYCVLRDYPVIQETILFMPLLALNLFAGWHLKEELRRLLLQEG